MRNAALHVGVFGLTRDERGNVNDVNTFLSLRGDKESWIRSKYVEKKFIQKLPETGTNSLLRRSSARRNRAATQERNPVRPPLKPKPNRATLPRVTGKHCEAATSQWAFRRPITHRSLSPAEVNKRNSHDPKSQRFSDKSIIQKRSSALIHFMC